MQHCSSCDLRRHPIRLRPSYAPPPAEPLPPVSTSAASSPAPLAQARHTPPPGRQRRPAARLGWHRCRATCRAHEGAAGRSNAQRWTHCCRSASAALCGGAGWPPALPRSPGRCPTPAGHPQQPGGLREGCSAAPSSVLPARRSPPHQAGRSVATRVAASASSGPNCRIAARGSGRHRGLGRGLWASGCPLGRRPRAGALEGCRGGARAAPGRTGPCAQTRGRPGYRRACKLGWAPSWAGGSANAAEGECPA
jgi:hypothetical protein